MPGTAAWAVAPAPPAVHPLLPCLAGQGAAQQQGHTASARHAEHAAHAAVPRLREGAHRCRPRPRRWSCRCGAAWMRAAPGGSLPLVEFLFRGCCWDVPALQPTVAAVAAAGSHARPLRRLALKMAARLAMPRLTPQLARGGGAGAGAPEVAAAAAAFRPAAVLGVDWHSVGAYEQLRGALPGAPPFIYLNYRWGHATPAAARPQARQCCAELAHGQSRRPRLPAWPTLVHPLPSATAEHPVPTHATCCCPALQRVPPNRHR